MILGGKAIAYGKNFERKVGKEKFAVFLLWMISKKEQHGYGIIKTIAADKGIPALPASKIYPILASLLKKGLITQKKVKQGKRIRKVYQITAKGKSAIRKAKEYMHKSRLMMAYAKDMVK